ncbi:MAG: MFS transporter [Reichenbachiella sp.]
MNKTNWILPIIVFSQFCCTSLWFAGNGVIDELIINFSLPSYALSYLTSSVQFGFITGTLTFSILAISDRYPPSKVFFWSALVAGSSNLAIAILEQTFYSLLSFRFLTGFFLAGIYPVGMKIAADYFDKGLGKSLGYLVGALVVGTAFPHFLNDFKIGFSWKFVILSTTFLAFTGGSLILMFVPNGPFRKPSLKFEWKQFLSVFRHVEFRSAAFGYFGHMWELYAFWAFVPFILNTYSSQHLITDFNISLWSFMIIAIGGPACVISGFLSNLYGVKKIAMLALTLSGICCLISPFAFYVLPTPLFLIFMFIWGMTAIADSPLFSTLVAQNASSELKGTALTIVNCIGFSITIVSIQILDLLKGFLNPNFLFMVLSIGPLTGIILLVRQNVDKTRINS